MFYALNGEAHESEESDIQHIERETISIDTLLYHGRMVHIRGINGARGAAWEALSAVLWNAPEAENRVWDAVEIAFEKETLISVRCSMMRPLAALFNMNKVRFSDAIHRLIVFQIAEHIITPHHAWLRSSPMREHTYSHIFSIGYQT